MLSNPVTPDDVAGLAATPWANQWPFTSNADLPRARSGILTRLTSGGVEPGKVLAQRIIQEIESPAEPTLGHDHSTNNLSRR
jgi:hypothetical protein